MLAVKNEKVKTGACAHLGAILIGEGQPQTIERSFADHLFEFIPHGSSGS
jgi:hypothetical protein